MNKEILKYPNPFLNKKAEEIKEISEDIKALAKYIIETMNNNQGVGLAATQIGESKRIIVVDAGDGPMIFFNPRIIKKSWKKEAMEEGCLSLPGYSLKIIRPKEVELEWLSEKGEKVKIKTDGMLARIIQHETDHLDGILLIDRLNFWQKLWA
ncbi:MAG: peptide deformylase [Parcubacteria group bacterium]|nr:MAG: peptide deformylase [Parcubacteria group bacterium]